MIGRRSPAYEAGSRAIMAILSMMLMMLMMMMRMIETMIVICIPTHCTTDVSRTPQQQRGSVNHRVGGLRGKVSLEGRWPSCHKQHVNACKPQQSDRVAGAFNRFTTA
uniref:Uncharacterized protein n=1 Tax=Anopheles atroparvus TaxID=41427 RepID=A0A182JL31_ANOAO